MFMNKDDVKVLLSDLYLDANEEDFEFIYQEFMSIYNCLKYFDDVDTTNVEAINWPFEITSTFLREDEVNHLLTSEEVLKNAADTQDEYVKYIKVV